MGTPLTSARGFREWQEGRDGSIRMDDPPAVGHQAEAAPAREPRSDRCPAGPAADPGGDGAQARPGGERLQALGLERIDPGTGDVEAAPVDESDLGTVAEVDVNLLDGSPAGFPEHDDRPRRADDRERWLEREARARELLEAPSRDALRSERRSLERVE